MRPARLLSVLLLCMTVPSAAQKTGGPMTGQ